MDNVPIVTRIAGVGGHNPRNCFQGRSSASMFSLGSSSLITEAPRNQQWPGARLQSLQLTAFLLDVYSSNFHRLTRICSAFYFFPLGVLADASMSPHTARKPRKFELEIMSGARNITLLITASCGSVNLMQALACSKYAGLGLSTSSAQKQEKNTSACRITQAVARPHLCMKFTTSHGVLFVLCCFPKCHKTLHAPWATCSTKKSTQRRKQSNCMFCYVSTSMQCTSYSEVKHSAAQVSQQFLEERMHVSSTKTT